MVRKLFLFCFVFIISIQLNSQSRWQLEPDGSILWKVAKGEAHSDNIEMSGQYISSIITYGVDEKGKLILNRQLVFPMLRTIPNDTHASLIYTFGQESSPVIRINNRQVQEQVTSVRLKGIIEVVGTYAGNVLFKRRIFPSTDKPACIEQFILTNNSGKKITVDIENFEKKIWTHPEKSFYEVYELSARVNGSGIYTLQTRDSMVFSVLYSGRKSSEDQLVIDAGNELDQREAFVSLMFSNLRFTCPDTVLSRMFDFAKIRAMESVFRTKGGLVHSPGGGAYYAAIWANDQAEYANPFFAYTGYPLAIEAGRTAWSWFAKYMNPEYKPIPSSIIAEGTDFWNGAGDRGDQAMIAYGASRFALALGDRKTAGELWPLIEWCIEYCRRKMTPEGVIASDSDELEGRFPAGKANLCTSSLLYDALLSASYLSKDLGKPKQVSENYSSMAKSLKAAIGKYFGAGIDGFNTYRYYDGNDVLRSWICIPLTMGIFDRAAGTTDALFSHDLWTDQGLLTQAGTTTFWDRSTLYGLRGVIAAGAVDRALPYLLSYSNKRLLGEHVPYAVEAWPEGNQRHLSAESALYCRIFTEGLFGYRPTGLSSFALIPQLPGKWNEMSLQDLVVCGGKKVDVFVNRQGNKIKVSVVSQGFRKEYLVSNGERIEVRIK
ncbi:MAG TPA: hypothetical protein VK155_10050 [Bacteroidales bacterium]|jgi:hypothetical protein|nr:hypothetical protein [Bacteroidales bacterium]